MREGKRANVPHRRAALPRYDPVWRSAFTGTVTTALRQKRWTRSPSVVAPLGAAGSVPPQCELCAAQRCSRTAETASGRASGTAALRGAARLPRKHAGSPPFSANAVKQPCLRQAPRFPAGSEGPFGPRGVVVRARSRSGGAGLCGLGAPTPPLAAQRFSPKLPPAFLLLFVQAYSFHRHQFAISDASLPPPGIS